MEIISTYFNQTSIKNWVEKRIFRLEEPFSSFGRKICEIVILNYTPGMHTVSILSRHILQDLL